MTLVGRLRAARLAPAVRDEAALYAPPPADIAAFQLARLNQGWAQSLARSPWARAMQARLALPAAFASWAELGARMPIQRKADLRLDLAAAATVESVSWRSTGGTTAEPLRFPVFASEARQAGLDIWIGRGPLGIAPDDRLFMIWGHALMFGQGSGAVMRRLWRRASDALLGYTRWSAYRLSPDDLRAAGDALAGSRAAYVVGYSCALDRMARANLDDGRTFSQLGLKAVIATAEGFPHGDSRQVIEACFGCPVIMEYGSVETGPIAYEDKAGGFDVFWARHRLEIIDGALIVTALNARALPLLRYAIGDAVDAGAFDGITRFAAVAGRTNEAVTIPGGAHVHSEAFTHILRDLPGLRAFQIVDRPGRVPLIRYEAPADLPAATLKTIADRLSRLDAALAATPLERVERLASTTAGKHRMVVQEGS